MGGKVREMILVRLKEYTNPARSDPYLERVNLRASRKVNDPDRVTRMSDVYPIATGAEKNKKGMLVGSRTVLSGPPPQIIVVPDNMYGFHNGTERLCRAQEL